MGYREPTTGMSVAVTLSAWFYDPPMNLKYHPDLSSVTVVCETIPLAREQLNIWLYLVLSLFLVIDIPWRTNVETSLNKDFSIQIVIHLPID